MVVGFMDTLLFFRKYYPELKGKCSLASLHKHFIDKEFEAHDAAGDVRALKDLLIHCKISLQELIATSITSEWVHDNIEYQAEVHQERVATSNPLIIANAIKAAYFRSGDDGVCTILSDKLDSKVRVTNSKRIITAIVTWLNTSVIPNN